MIKDFEWLNEVGGLEIVIKRSRGGKVAADLGGKGPIAKLTKTQTKRALQYHSRVEDKNKKAQGPQIPRHECPVNGCTAAFSTPHQLMTHRVRTHGYRDMYRSLVIDEYCLMCNKPFASKPGARNHIQKVCGVKGTEEERMTKVREIIRTREIQTGQKTPIAAWLGL